MHDNAPNNPQINLHRFYRVVPRKSRTPRYRASRIFLRKIPTDSRQNRLKAPQKCGRGGVGCTRARCQSGGPFSWKFAENSTTRRQRATDINWYTDRGGTTTRNDALPRRLRRKCVWGASRSAHPRDSNLPLWRSLNLSQRDSFARFREPRDKCSHFCLCSAGRSASPFARRLRDLR